MPHNNFGKIQLSDISGKVQCRLINMTMTGKEKLYFLLDAIVDARDIAPSGQPLVIDPVNDLNRKYRPIELIQLFTKLVKDEKVLRVIQAPSWTKEDDIIRNLDPYDYADDGCWHIELLPSFAEYFFRTQSEPEYFEFTGRKPTPIKVEDKEIDQWLERKNEETLKKIRQVVLVLNSEWQLRDEDTFKIPIEKLVKDWVDNERELEAVLSNLHNRKIIEVSRKLGETPPTNDLNKPQGSIWATIIDQPEIIRREDTQIRLFTKKFDYLVNKLHTIAAESGNAEKTIPTTQQSSTGIEWQEDFQWHGNDFVFGDYGKATFVSPDRKKLFRLLTDAKGHWVTVQKMVKETEKDEGTYIRPTLGQIERQLDSKIRKHISIPSTQEDDAGQKPSQGAYRLKFVSKPQQPQHTSVKKSP